MGFLDSQPRFLEPLGKKAALAASTAASALLQETIKPNGVRWLTENLAVRVGLVVNNESFGEGRADKP